MAIFPRLVSPFLFRRLLVELRGIRRALERQADCAELLAGGSPRSAQSFRSFSREASPSDGHQTEVSYVNNAYQSIVADKEMELVSLLGRLPTADEVIRAIEGEIE